MFKEKKDFAIKAMKKSCLEDAEKFLSDAILIYPKVSRTDLTNRVRRRKVMKL